MPEPDGVLELDIDEAELHVMDPTGLHGGVNPIELELAGATTLEDTKEILDRRCASFRRRG